MTKTAISLSLAVLCAASTAHAAEPITHVTVTVAAPDGAQLGAVLYRPVSSTGNRRAVVMMHGCTGMWVGETPFGVRADGFPVVRREISKWGKKLASEGVYALAVDSYTARAPGSPSGWWQRQCVGDTWENAVDRVRVRPGDAVAGYQYLASLAAVDADRIGVLGWSQGGEATLVALAATPPDQNTATNPFTLKAGVAMFPACGFLDLFGGISGSYWRPHAAVRIEHAALDTLVGNCTSRVNRAWDLLGWLAGMLDFTVHPKAKHNFDLPPLSEDDNWPPPLEFLDCAVITDATADRCAERKADNDALAFFLDAL